MLSRWSKSGCFWGRLVLMPFLWRARRQFNLRLWLRLAGIGIINSAIPFVLFAWAAQRAPAGIGAIANATAVMFTALVALIFFGESITTRRAMGLVAGFVGVAVLASGKTNGVSVWPAALAGTLASVLYGFGGNLIKRQLVGLPAAAVAAATLFCASVFNIRWHWPLGRRRPFRRCRGCVGFCSAWCALASPSLFTTG